MKPISIEAFCRLLGQEAQLSLVAVVDAVLNQRIDESKLMLSHYAIVLYEHEGGSEVFTLAPGFPTTVFSELEPGTRVQALVFHPDLLLGSSLERDIKVYPFLYSNGAERFTPSPSERAQIYEIFAAARRLFDEEPDMYLTKIIMSEIRLLLNFLLRYFDRHMRRSNPDNQPQNAPTLYNRFMELLDRYIENDGLQHNGIPTVAYCATQFCMSTGYFSDLLRHETGVSPQAQIQARVVSEAKRLLRDSDEDVSNISWRLGFEYPQHFARMFKRVTGLAPAEWRKREKGEEQE